MLRRKERVEHSALTSGVIAQPLASFCAVTVTVLLVLTTLAGCCCTQQTNGSGWTGKPAKGVGAYDPQTPNPLFVQTSDAQWLWDAAVDVLDNYYQIEVENPIRTYERVGQNGQTYVYQTEGRIDTKPSIMGGCQEFWRKNRADCGNRLFATLQTVRSTAVMRITPEANGFFVYLTVYDELEDMPKPIGSRVGYNLNFNDDLTQLSQPTGEYSASKGWITIGRDEDLERRIMKELAWRVMNPRSALHVGVDAELTP